MTRVLADITPAYVSFNDGQFDTRYRYLRRVDYPTALAVSDGPTWLLVNGAYVSYASGPRPTATERASAGSVWPVNTGAGIDAGSNTSGAPGASLDLSPAGIVIQDPATGRLLFDPSLPIMHVLNECTGFVDIPAQNLYANAVDVAQSMTLATIDPAATHIIGSVQTDFSITDGVQRAPGAYTPQDGSTTGTAGTDWWAVNGSFVSYAQYGELGTGQSAGKLIGTRHARVVSWSQLTFTAVSGALVMSERTKLPGISNGMGLTGQQVAAYSRQPYRLNYKLKAVVFT